jgi:mannose-6-phosphate isomerase-like protein (cupin superfamily)
MEIITNTATGDRMKIFRSSLWDQGDVFELEVTLQPYNKWSKFPHYHPITTETFKVVSGRLNMIVGTRELLLDTSSPEVVVAPMQVHCFWNDSPDEVTFRSVISPVSTIEQGIRATYAMGSAGKMNRHNLPRNVFEFALLGELLDGYSPKLPMIVQKGLIKLVAGIGALLGYRRSFQQYLSYQLSGN